MKRKEFILCASIWYKDIIRESKNPKCLPTNIESGIVVSAYRHENCIAIFKDLTGLRSVKTEVGEMVYGFLTSHNRFVDRKEAAEIAFKEGQVIQDIEDMLIIPDKLYSEHLY
jgi:hypothetical protein